MSQGQTPGLSHERTPGGEPGPQLTEERIREELNRVLASHEFRSSKRSQEFLRYVVENTLGGHSDLLKERTIGIDVFGRPASYDPSDDATVRVKAGEVRKRLGLYYSDQGAADPIRIELPSGTYVPEFRAGQTAPVEQPALKYVPVPHVDFVVRTSRLRIVAIVAVLALGVAALAWWKMRPAATALDAFWAPV